MMKRYVVLSLLVAVSMLFTACAPAAPQVITVEKEVVVEKPVMSPLKEQGSVDGARAGRCR